MRKQKTTPEFETEEEMTIQPWTPEGQTILSTMEYLTPVTNVAGFIGDATLIKDAPEAYAFLENRLGLPHSVVMTLVGGVYYTASNEQFSVRDITQLMCLHPIHQQQVSADMDILYDNGYIYPTYVRGRDKQWRVPHEVMKALREDRAFDIKELRSASNMEFLEDASRIIGDSQCYEEHRILHLMHINEHLPVVRNLRNVAPDKDSMKVLLSIMVTIAVDGYAYGNMTDFINVVSPSSARDIMRGLKKNTHPFVQQGILEPYGANGMAQSEQWCLSRAGWTMLLENVNEVEQILCPEGQSSPLTSHEKLQKKTLFFSGKTAEQVKKLQELLSDEQYHKICNRLRKNGFSAGIPCLFYGTPGTGKTELVQQLAIETGRDIYQVNLASLRDKYVGETEKRVQGIFSTYRTFLHRRDKAPILLFNEADAIFGKRMEHTEHSVDKMENAVQNIILQEMEQFEGIMICTTNLTSNLDSAFDRRFLYKVEFERPSNEARKKIWQSKLKDLTEEQAEMLADRYDFSGGQIENITRKQIINSVLADTDHLDFEQIMRDCGEEKLNRDNGKKIGF